MDRKSLEKRVARQSRQWQKAGRDRHFLSQLGLLGTLGLLFVIPLVAGAYLGSWLDARLEGFSTRWTVSLIIVGVFVGAFNVYFYIRDTDGEPHDR
ncbi:AtpZ/AtpI family protein [Alteromonas sp. CYL-A6]|uniref:AtpZ/AtpI family protein n=1 Tax=Alteromonas nitratireducens TaxID=3390813 RepID=UPI0034B6056A